MTVHFVVCEERCKLALQSVLLLLQDEKGDDARKLEHMSAGLPKLRTLAGKSSEDHVSRTDSGNSGPPSLSTPAPSEASLATASTTTSTASLRSSTTTSDIAAAKAIEAVRRSIGTRDGEGLTLDQLTKQAEEKQQK